MLQMLHTVSNEHLLCHCVSRVINLKTELLVWMFLFIYKNKTAHTPSSLAPFLKLYSSGIPSGYSTRKKRSFKVD